MDNRNKTMAGRDVGRMDMSVDQGLRSYMLGVYNYMMVALFVTGAVAYAASKNIALMKIMYGTPLQWVVMLAPLGVVFYLSMRIHKMSIGSARFWFFAFSVLVGLSISYIFLAYKLMSIAQTFFITAASFGALSLYGYTTKRDLSGLGTFLFMGLIGIIIASIINLFLRSSMMNYVISVLGVLIFAGLTAYDTQKIKMSYYTIGQNAELAARYAIMGALTLYLDFINLFLFLLRFLGVARD